MQRPTLHALTVLLLAATPVMGQEGTGPSVRAFGFGDVNFLTTELDRQEGFQLGQMVGHLTAVMDDHVSFFGEVSLTRRDGGYVIEAERAFIRYDVMDEFKVSAGRFHTPVGYWNTAYHHGSWLHTSVARPEMIKFGGQFIPTHFVGVLAEGTLAASGLGLAYTVGIGNGRHSNIARGGDAGDINGERAVTLGLKSRPLSIQGLELGASFYSDRISDPTRPETDERIFAVHGVWDRSDIELLGEYARVTHEEVATGTGATGSNGYYIQVGYRLPNAARTLKPYVRIEAVDPTAGDPIFTPADLQYDAILAGIRYDAGPYLALRAEIRGEEIGTLERMTSLYLQASFVIAGS